MPSPSDLRPFPVLDLTVSYLIQEIACNNIHSEGWADRYNFVTDRLRAVRQDMVIQNLPPADCITLLKPMVKFHVFAAYWLCESPINAFDPKINTLFLQECIKRLLIMFNIIREKTGDYFNEDRKEFEHKCENCESDEHLIRALYLLINLGNVEALNQATVRLWNCSSGCDKCIETKAFEVSLASWNGNYSKVCKLLRKLPPLLVMAAAVNLPSIRRHALAVMSIAYNNKTLRFPLDVLQETLMWNNKDQVVQECKHYGVAVEKTEDTKLYACFQKGTFNSQVKQLQPFRLNWLDDILSNVSLAKILENHG